MSDDAVSAPILAPLSAASSVARTWSRPCAGASTGCVLRLAPVDWHRTRALSRRCRRSTSSATAAATDPARPADVRAAARQLLRRLPRRRAGRLRRLAAARDVKVFGAHRGRRDQADVRRPAARGAGHARAMLAHLERTAAAAGHRAMVLETGTAQPEAIALYESSGYTPIPSFGHYRGRPRTAASANVARADAIADRCRGSTYPRWTLSPPGEPPCPAANPAPCRSSWRWRSRRRPRPAGHAPQVTEPRSRGTPPTRSDEVLPEGQGRHQGAGRWLVRTQGGAFGGISRSCASGGRRSTRRAGRSTGRSTPPGAKDRERGRLPRPGPRVRQGRQRRCPGAPDGDHVRHLERPDLRPRTRSSAAVPQLLVPAQDASAARPASPRPHAHLAEPGRRRPHQLVRRPDRPTRDPAAQPSTGASAAKSAATIARSSGSLTSTARALSHAAAASSARPRACRARARASWA